METLKLPVSDFEWITKSDFKRWTVKDIINIPSQGKTGYALKVDLHYPSRLHPVNPIFVVTHYLLLSQIIRYLFQAHNQFPLAPYTDTISFKHLSPYNRRLLKHQCPRDYRNKRYRSKKLLSTFYDRKKYVVHLENLQYYLKKRHEAAEDKKSCEVSAKSLFERVH